MTDEEKAFGAGEKLRRGFAELGEHGAPGPECPEPDRLWAAAAGEGTAEERQAVIAHTTTCSSCAAAFRLARGLGQGGDEAAGGGKILSLSRGSSWRRWGVPLAAVAAVLAVALLVPSPLSHTLSSWVHPTPIYRGGEPLEVLSRLPEETALPRAAADLIWSEGPAGSRYEVRVSNRAGEEIVVESGLETPRYRIPESVLSGSPAGARLYWQVRMLPPDGPAVVSKTFSVRIE
jgi:hypothetical protein